MPENVTIKGVDDRLEIHFSDSASYEEIKEELTQKLDGSGDFFKNSSAKLVIYEDGFTEEQRSEIKNIFSSEKVFFSDEDHMAEADDGAGAGEETAKGVFQNLTIEKPEPEKGRLYDAPSVFISHSVKDDEHIVSSGDIVVIGDVEKGSELIAGGSIAVFGRLCGVARAGAFGRTDVCVAALYMESKSIRVSGVDAPPDERSPRAGEIAELKHGEVVIRPIENEPEKKSFSARFRSLFGG